MNSSPSNWTDQELLEKYRREHNNEWLGMLLERYLHLIFGVCMKYLQNEEDARDHAQQICLKILKTLPRHQVTYFKSWLYQVAKNHCLMELRRSRRIHILPLSEQKPVENDESPGDEQDPLAREKQYIHLQEALGMLNEAQRKCIDLFYLRKKTYRKVADATGFSLQQVKSYIQNGKRNLKLIMERLAAEKNTKGDTPAEGNDRDG